MVTVVGLTQGIQMVGENLPSLTADRLELLDALRPTMPVPARPLDLFSPKPGRLLTRTPHGDVLALLNWSDEPIALTVDAEEICGGRPATIYEVWTDRWLGVRDGRVLRVDVPPHGTSLLLLRPARRHPAFLGFNGHVSGGAILLEGEAWDAASRTLSIEFSANRAGWIGIRVPVEWVPTDGEVVQREGEHWTIPVARGANAVVLRFERAR